MCPNNKKCHTPQRKGFSAPSRGDCRVALPSRAVLYRGSRPYASRVNRPSHTAPCSFSSCAAPSRSWSASNTLPRPSLTVSSRLLLLAWPVSFRPGYAACVYAPPRLQLVSPNRCLCPFCPSAPWQIPRSCPVLSSRLRPCFLRSSASRFPSFLPSFFPSVAGPVTRVAVVLSCRRRALLVAVWLAVMQLPACRRGACLGARARGEWSG